MSSKVKNKMAVLLIQQPVIPVLWESEGPQGLVNSSVCIKSRLGSGFSGTLDEQEAVAFLVYLRN